MSTDNQNYEEILSTENVQSLSNIDLSHCTDELISDLYQHIIELQDDLASVSKKYNMHFDSELQPVIEPLSHLSVRAEREVDKREALDRHEIVRQARRQE